MTLIKSNPSVPATFDLCHLPTKQSARRRCCLVDPPASVSTNAWRFPLLTVCWFNSSQFSCITNKDPDQATIPPFPSTPSTDQAKNSTRYRHYCPDTSIAP